MKGSYKALILAVGVVGVILAATLAGFLSPNALAQQQPPRNTDAPSIDGTAREGQTLTARNGTWTGNPTGYTYQWLRCNAGGQSCSPISGETNRRYAVRANDVDRTLSVLVTARNAAGASGPTNSAPTSVVAGTDAPRNTSRPTISGRAAAGEELRADPGRWTGSPTRYAYQWQRCDAAGANCANVSGARGEAYGVRAADAGNTLRVEVTATNANGSAVTQSDRTNVVGGASGGGGNTGGGGNSVDVSQVALPERLVISQVSFVPRFIQSRDVPVTMLIRVTDTRGRLVRNALVYAIGLPYGRIAQSPEVATQGNGVAEVTLRPTQLLPLQQGAALVLFVRARKAGDSVLAGVSSRRLVQVLVNPNR